MRIAIEGCGHGTLHAIYASIKKSCQINSWNGVDLLIIGGDFQAVRNAYDLNTMSVPAKYRAIGDFHEYYSGKRVAPYLTIFVGGNHEASSHLQELYYGGWVAKNIYYLGAANVIRFGDLRIAGLSGIWKGYNYNKPHFERLPYNADEVKSLYHVRELDIRKLLLLRTQVDIGISHDWPRGIEWKGDYKSLFRQKDLFEADAKAGTLGSSAAMFVMNRLRPPHWFSAHLHCKYAALVDWSEQAEPPTQVKLSSDTPMTEPINDTKNNDEIDLDLDDNIIGHATTSMTTKNDDEIGIELDEEDEQEVMTPVTDKNFTARSMPPLDHPVVPPDIRAQLPAAFSRPPPTILERLPSAPPPSGINSKTTRFLALDKCLPNRKFLQILKIKPISNRNKSEKPQLAYDAEWLAILRVFGNHDPHCPFPPNLGELAYTPLIQAQEAWVEENLVKTDKMLIPDNFELSAPIFQGGDIRAVGREQPKEHTNPQTKTFCEMLGITNWFDATDEERDEMARVKAREIEAGARADGFGHGGGLGGASRGWRGGRGGSRGRGSRGRGRGRGMR